MRVSEPAPILLLAALLLMPGWGLAQDKASREREALVRSQRAVAKLQQENAALSRERGEIAAKLETATKELEELRGQAARARGRAAATEKELLPLREERDALKQKLEAAEKLQAETVAQCGAAKQAAEQSRRRLESEGSALGARLRQETQSLQACSAANDRLYALGRELMRAYEAAARERVDPVFGLRMVEIENAIEGYRDRADESRLPAAARP